MTSNSPETASRPLGISILGSRFDCLTERQVLDRIGSALSHGKGGWVVTPNLDSLRQVNQERSLQTLIDGASEVVADGMPLVWASRLQGTPLPERVAGSNLAWSACAEAAAHRAPVFLLGGNPGVAEDAAERLLATTPGLSVAGTFAPPFGFEHDPDAVPDMARVIASSGARVVLVGLGFPKQERLICQLRPACPDVWFLGVGIALSFIAGDIRRAPAWMQAVGLEWAHRLRQEPRRLAKRYLVHGVPFGLRLLAAALRVRLRRQRPGQLRGG